MRRPVLYGLFFLSGVSALMYELLWQRLLHLVFGVSTLAVSAVLAAFLGGLALGGLLFGRRADRARRPLRGYALVEVGIAVTALLVPAGFALVTDFYTSVAAAWQPGPWGGALLRFGLSLLVLGVPATLIGATLPFMGRLTARSRGRLPTDFSLLYGVNTLGAVIGAGLTGFVLLRYLGMQHTLWLAASINALVAVAAFLTARTAENTVEASEVALPEPEAVTGAPRLPHAGLWLGCAALTGAVSTGLEVAWSRVLGVFTSNSAYAFALVLCVLLLGLGAGSLLQSLWSRRRGDSWRRLALCQLLLAALTLGTVSCFHTAPAWLDRWCDGSSAGWVFLGELVLTAAALFLPGVLMGISFPLLASGLAAEPREFGRRLGRLYGVNTLGCVAGAFVAGFVLIPQFGLRATLGGCAAGSLAVGLAAWAWTSRPTWPIRGVVAALLIVAAAATWQYLPGGGYSKSAVEGQRSLLYYREGNNGTVSVIQEASGIRTLFVDGQPVAGTAGTSVMDQKMLAHLPLLLHPAPRRALTVGFGSGGTSHSMTLHGVDVDCVEIERAVPDAAEHFRSENDDVRSHPNFRLVVDDARSWLRVADGAYDAIVTDCTNLQYKSNGDLYTVEYFDLMRRRLSADGVAAAWVPANGIDAADLKTLLRSFRAAFPHTSVWHMNTMPTDFLIVVGTRGTLNVDFDHLRQRMEQPAIRTDLERVGLADPVRLLYTFLTADAGLDRYLGSGPLNTDDRPVLSYSTYGATFRATIPTNLVQLLACRQDVAGYVNGVPGEMLRQYAASNEVLLGHVALLGGDAGMALHHYVAGAKLLPDDPIIRQLALMAYAQVQCSDRPTAP